MLGVVLWSDASDRKAVIWCEDQGDLAYVSEFTSAMNSGDFFDAGDLVQFDMEMHKSMRLANNPRLVIEKAGAERHPGGIAGLAFFIRRGKVPQHRSAQLRPDQAGASDPQRHRFSPVRR